MADINIDRLLGRVHLADMLTDADIQAEAERLLPDAIRQIVEHLAENQWRRSLANHEPPGTDPAETERARQTYIESTARDLADQMDDESKQKLRGVLADQIRLARRRALDAGS